LLSSTCVLLAATSIVFTDSDPAGATTYGPQRTLIGPTLGSKGQEIAVDVAGDVFVDDPNLNQVYEFPHGSAPQTQLPISGLSSPGGIAVDAAGDVFVTDDDTKQVIELQYGSTSQIELPLSGFGIPEALAVDQVGNVFIDYGTPVHRSDTDQIVELATGSNTPTVLPFDDLANSDGVAVDTKGERLRSRRL
jgi:serine/threonine-protein kinase